jgi:hypothetical protein
MIGRGCLRLDSPVSPFSHAGRMSIKWDSFSEIFHRFPFGTPAFI